MILQFKRETMKAVNFRVQGRILEANGRYALLLHDTQPKPEAGPLLYLRLAFTTAGVEEPVFPAFLLDDWGNEIKSTDLYKWVDEFAPQFPRAELFGFDAAGQETQLFLRELELVGKWPCYAYPAAATPVGEGVLVEAILLPDEAVGKPVKIKRPSWVERPLRRARVQWWQVPPTIQTIAGILT
jgi:hypothetical protein